MNIITSSKGYLGCSDPRLRGNGRNSVAIKDLIAVCPPPAQPADIGSAKQLEQIERKLGTRLPGDYRDFALRYGSGTFCDGFLLVYNPFVVDLTADKRIADCFYREGLLPWPPFPAKPGLLEIGSNESGDTLFYLTKLLPDDWPLLVVPHGEEDKYETWDIGLTTFLAKALMNKLDTAVFNKEPVKAKDRVFVPSRGRRKGS
jgi:hypothetical protein